MLKTRGLNHIDLGTKDMAATRAFYEGVLGFPLVRADLVDIGDDGRLQHFFFDIGNGQLLGFMSGEDVRGYPKEFDAQAGTKRLQSRDARAIRTMRIDPDVTPISDGRGAGRPEAIRKRPKLGMVTAGPRAARTFAGGCLDALRDDQTMALLDLEEDLLEVALGRARTSSFTSSGSDVRSMPARDASTRC